MFECANKILTLLEQNSLFLAGWYYWHRSGLQSLFYIIMMIQYKRCKSNQPQRPTGFTDTYWYDRWHKPYISHVCPILSNMCKEGTSVISLCLKQVEQMGTSGKSFKNSDVKTVLKGWKVYCTVSFFFRLGRKCVKRATCVFITYEGFGTELFCHVTLENALIGVVLNFPIILNACSILGFMQFSAITVDPIRTEKLCGTVWECQRK
jgi:hypothetical protein